MRGQRRSTTCFNRGKERNRRCALTTTCKTLELASTSRSLPFLSLVPFASFQYPRVFLYSPLNIRSRCCEHASPLCHEPFAWTVLPILVHDICSYAPRQFSARGTDSLLRTDRRENELAIARRAMGPRRSRAGRNVSRSFVPASLQRDSTTATLLPASVARTCIHDLSARIDLPVRFTRTTPQRHKRIFGRGTRSGFLGGVRHCCACVNSSGSARLGVSVTRTHARLRL